MAEEDEIDILGDFSFNSCFAQNNQGIPSCSDREDTVHPQWLLDKTANNWYDAEDKKKNRRNEGPSRKLSGNNGTNKCEKIVYTTVWNTSERNTLKKEMAKYGRDIDKISKTLKSKSKAEIQALIEAEHGIVLDTPASGLLKCEESDNVPHVVQEVVLEDFTPVRKINNVMTLFNTGVPTVPIVQKSSKKNQNATQKISKLSNSADIFVDHSEIFYEDDLLVASTELITPDKVDTIKNANRKVKKKIVKKMCNHKRKGHIYDKDNIGKNKELLRLPPGRHRKESNVSSKYDDSTNNPKMHIVLGSGQALPVSEGEEVIKIENKKESEGETDIEVDIDTDEDDKVSQRSTVQQKEESSPEARKVMAVRKFEPMPKRNRKINLDGGGGYTIMHTEAGDMYEVREEPRKEKPTKPPVIQLYPCRVYNADKPAPFEVYMHVSTLVAMDAHAHTSRAEVAGLVGGDWRPPRLLLRRYRHVRAAAQRTHCDMDPVSQAAAGEWLRAHGLTVVGWHHSHPAFPATPSATDLHSQRALQALPATAPSVALITSQHWPVGRAASHYRCIRVEDAEDDTDIPAGYQLSVKLVSDLSAASVPGLLRELRELSPAARDDDLRVDMGTDTCPQAGMTYLEKLVSSVSQHMRSAGYADDDAVVTQLTRGIREVFSCIRVEDAEDDTDIPAGYQLSVKLVSDLSAASVPGLLRELRELSPAARDDDLRVDMGTDTCPQAGMTYLEKLVSSVSQHMRSAGYADDDAVVTQLTRGIREVFSCIRVEDAEDDTDIPAGYQLSVKLVSDLSAASVPGLLRELRELSPAARDDDLRVDMGTDTCPQAGMTYLEKLVSSVSQHMRSAGYADDDAVVTQLTRGIREVFR